MSVTNVKTGLELVRMHHEFESKIREIETAVHKLDEFSYTKKVLQDELDKLTEALSTFESTRFQALEPVVITTSLLGGRP